MENIILVILCILAALLLLAAFALFFMPKKKGESINIHVDSGSSLKIIQNDEGVRLDIIYETSEDARPSYEMFPDIVESACNDAVNSGAPSNNFWLEVASLDELEPERREQVVMKLEQLGIIKKDHVRNFLYPEEENPIVPEFPDDDFFNETAAVGLSAPAQDEVGTDSTPSAESETGPVQPAATDKEGSGDGFKFNEFNL